MKSEEIMEAINELEDGLITEAEKARGKQNRGFYIRAACALLAVGFMIGGLFLFRNEEAYRKPKAYAAALAEPEYPPQKQWEEYMDPRKDNQASFVYAPQTKPGRGRSIPGPF